MLIPLFPSAVIPETRARRTLEASNTVFRLYRSPTPCLDIYMKNNAQEDKGHFRSKVLHSTSDYFFYLHEEGSTLFRMVGNDVLEYTA
jgi:hypothetical protein